jgi:rubredoxin
VFSSSPGAGRPISTEATISRQPDGRGTARKTGPQLTFRAVKYMCSSCGFIYDPEVGDPDGGIPPGTPFEQIPDTWFCPVCGARKQDFEPYEE